MSCCGKKRSAVNASSFSRPTVDYSLPTAPPGPRMVPPQQIVFEYLGATELTAQGPVTRKLYRFSGPRARVAVDLRDAPSIAGVPKLRRVR